MLFRHDRDRVEERLELDSEDWFDDDVEELPEDDVDDLLDDDVVFVRLVELWSAVSVADEFDWLVVEEVFDEATVSSASKTFRACLIFKNRSRAFGWSDASGWYSLDFSRNASLTFFSLSVSSAVNPSSVRASSVFISYR
ncbi:hypothetical protein C435_11395 [Haloarcula marismortui ATCC 33799]|uniref:Uncharacterized protein n=1 Tax=Haloarcula marismortui ATCC 33799 TaxID=662475 RepID=M0K7C8_9EURY|nr:hypothetical protein C435_11395 [Haloarcula californiae ATCC 33799]